MNSSSQSTNYKSKFESSVIVGDSRAEGIYGYGPQYETCSDSFPDWKTVSFSWQYGVWDNPGAQGYHGLKGKISDGFFILDRGGLQRFRTYVYVKESGTSFL